jgi:hypothetical protein
MGLYQGFPNFLARGTFFCLKIFAEPECHFKRKLHVIRHFQLKPVLGIQIFSGF